ncbi:MAG: hypothetical protein ACLTAX_13025 [Waltera sp.]
MEEAGEEYLFLYSKIGARNAMICALIPQANIIGQTAEIKNVSLILVVAASAVAILLGSLFGRTVWRLHLLFYPPAEKSL